MIEIIPWAYMNLNQYIEYTALGEDLNEQKISEHIEEAIRLKAFGICLNLAWTSLARKVIAKRPLKLISVIDFPLGKEEPRIKALQAQAAKAFGADEIDMV